MTIILFPDIEQKLLKKMDGPVFISMKILRITAHRLPFVFRSNRKLIVGQARHQAL